jgi:2-methylcitrate dehydratase PrpD
VGRVALRCNPLVLELTGKKTPRNTLEAKLSVYYSAAVAIASRRVAEREYGDSFLNDPTVLALRDKVTVEPVSSVREDETEVTIELTDGNSVHCHIDHVIGSVKRPMSDKDMLEKFHGLVETVLPSSRIDQLLDACWNITKLDDVSALAHLAAR